MSSSGRIGSWFVFAIGVISAAAMIWLLLGAPLAIVNNSATDHDQHPGVRQAADTLPSVGNNAANFPSKHAGAPTLGPPLQQAPTLEAPVRETAFKKSTTDQKSDDPIASDQQELPPLAPPEKLTVRRQQAQIAPPVADLFDPSKPVVDSPLLAARKLPNADPLPKLPLKKPGTTRPGSAQNTPSPSSPSDQAAPNQLPGGLPLLPSDQQTEGEKIWAYPLALAKRLEELSRHQASREWARQVLQQIDLLNQIGSLKSNDSAAPLKRLDELAAEASLIATRDDASSVRKQLLQTRYALARRLEIWNRLNRLPPGDTLDTPKNPQAILAPLAAVEQEVRRLRQFQRWRDYLLMDQVSSQATRFPPDVAARRKLARRVLLRINSPALSPKQQAFFARTVFHSYLQELKRWSAEPVDYRAMLQSLERFQQYSDRDNAGRVADAYQVLRWSQDEQTTEMADQIDAHFRNANFRMAISAELLNRMLPKLKNTRENVDEDIQGARVIGRSEASTRLWIRLLPDNHRLRLGLEAYGEVASDTEADAGSAIFYNQSYGRYQARKLLTIDQRGLHVWRSEAEAESSTDVTDVQTNYDGIPLLGSLAQSMAMMKREEQQYEAQAEADNRIANRASSRLDRAVHRRLAEVEKKFQTRILDPFVNLKLNPMARDLQTTAKRLIVRYRLAGFSQLAAYTPRPVAPSDSLLSVQIHQSAINNIIQQLQLDGRRVELRELYRLINKSFNRPEDDIPEDLPSGVTLQFAERDAVQVRFEDGRASITLALAELSKRRGRRWRNFTVRGNYIPQGEGLNARLVRDSYVELDGEYLGLGDQIALRGVFSRVFSQNRPIPLVPKRIAEEPRLAHLRANQLVVDDQWIGLALGPDRRIELNADKKKLRFHRQARRP